MFSFGGLLFTAPENSGFRKFNIQPMVEFPYCELQEGFSNADIG